MRTNVLEQLTVERLKALLAVPSEESNIDFKEDLDLTTPRGTVEFAKDVLAFANSGGGHCVVGVTDGMPRNVVGLSQSGVSFLSEPKRLNDAVRKYVGGHIVVSAAIHSIPVGADSRPVGIVFIPGHARKVPAQDNGIYPEPSNPAKQHWAFRKGDVYIRKGDQSCKVETPDDLVARGPAPTPLPNPSKELSSLHNPYNIAAIASDHMFKGRELEIEKLLDSIETGTHTAVFGLQRIGKTSLVRQVLFDKLKARRHLSDCVLFAMLDFQNLGNDYTYRGFLDSLVQAVAKNVPNVSAKEVSSHIALFASQYARGSKQQMLGGFRELIEKLASRSNKKIIVFFDEFSELCRVIERNELRAADLSHPTPMRHPHELPVDGDLMHWFSALMKSSTLKGKVVFLFAVRPFIAEYDDYRNFQILKLTKSITLYHLNEAAARELITEPLRSDVSYAPDAVDYLVSLTDAHPYLLQMFLIEIVDRLRRERRRNVIKSDIQEFEEMLIAEGPAYDAQFKLLDTDYSIDDVINPARVKLSHGILALIAKLGHHQKEGWVNIENVCQSVMPYGRSREDTYSLIDQLVKAKILSEKQTDDELFVRFSIPLLRKRYVRQNMYLKYFRSLAKA